MTGNKNKTKEYIPFSEWNKMIDETKTIWVPENKHRVKNPRRVTQFSRNR